MQHVGICGTGGLTEIVHHHTGNRKSTKTVSGILSIGNEHIMAQDTHYHSKTQRRKHSKEILDQIKTEKQLDKLQTLHLHV